MTDKALFDLGVGFDTSRARRSDPVTSHEAADSITTEGLHAAQQAVLDTLRSVPVPMAAWVIEERLPEWSPSRIRSALVELERGGMVARHEGAGITPRRRRCDTFSVVTA